MTKYTFFSDACLTGFGKEETKKYQKLPQPQLCCDDEIDFLEIKANVKETHEVCLNEEMCDLFLSIRLSSSTFRCKNKARVLIFSYLSLYDSIETYPPTIYSVSDDRTRAQECEWFHSNSNDQLN